MIRIVMFLVFFWAGVAGVSGGNEKDRPFTVPRPEEIVAFTNGLPPGTGGRIEKRKGDIMRFLKHGKPKWNVPITYGYDPPGGMINQEDGVILDNKGRFYFWSFNSRKVLLLEVPDGRFVALELRK